ncbi:MAG: GNAT family N-acetyltransferase [Micrococcus sp.]|nr:GNAT family N-acetyltransferase [Micrococcus sp.]
MQLVQPAPRWSQSTAEALRRATGGRARILHDADTPALLALAEAAPIANAFVASLVQSGRLAGPRGRGMPSLFVAVGEPDAGPGSRLEAVAWVGSNVVPLFCGAGRAASIGVLGTAIAALGRRFGSLYGPHEPVLAIEAELRRRGHRPRCVREVQPLLSLTGATRCEGDPRVTQASPAQFDAVLAASAAMFEEELGVSPFRDAATSYIERVRRLIHDGRVLIRPDGLGVPVFKADIGTLSRQCAQLQGIWVRPDRRGEGIAAAATAAAVDYARRLAPQVSLYVNDFNTAALRTYARVGFERVGTFATVLY